jgi:hypothetical protein
LTVIQISFGASCPFLVLKTLIEILFGKNS